MKSARILVLDAKPANSVRCACGSIALLIRRVIGAEVICGAVQKSLGPATEPAPGIVILRVSGRESLSALLNEIRATWTGASVIALLCPDTPDERPSADLALTGFDDFLCCPAREIEIVPRIQKLLGLRRRLRAEAVLPWPDAPPWPDAMIGRSESFLSAIRRVLCIAQSEATVLITGETGTGKELFARAIHYSGARKSKAFIPVNCGAIPDHLMENELFGHARGAYTDAATAQQGLVAEAEGGTLFLDEVDALSLCTQTKLLRFLQDRQYRPLGSGRTLVGDVRILAATNADLRKLVELRQFREDLFHRLNILCVAVPPLRERTGDIPLIANHFLELYEGKYSRSGMRLSSAALRRMIAYSWPGNVRELESLIHRAVVLATSLVVEESDIQLPADHRGANEKGSLREARDRTIESFERVYLTELMMEHKGNLSQAAKAAGKDRRGIQRLMRKHGLERVAFARLP